MCPLNFKTRGGTWTPLLPPGAWCSCQGARVARVIQGIVGGPSSRRGPGGKLGQGPGSRLLPGPVAIRPSDLSRTETDKKLTNIQVGYLRIFIAIYATQKRNRRGQILFHLGLNLVMIEKFNIESSHCGTQSTDLMDAKVYNLYEIPIFVWKFGKLENFVSLKIRCRLKL